MKAIRAAGVVLVSLAVVACGEQGGDQAAMDEEEAADRQMREDPAGQQAAPGTDVALSSRNDSGITGTARMTPQGDSLAVQVSLSGLTEGDSYAAHVHQGTCESGGGVAVGLNAVTGQADGSGSSTKAIGQADLEAGESYFVQVHLPDGTPAACGDVPSMPESSADMDSGSDM